MLTTPVMARYLYRVGAYTPSNWELKGLAIGCYTAAVFILIISNRLALVLQNVIGSIKLLTLLFIAITGLVVLGGHTHVPKSGNFTNAFEGTQNNAYPLVNALVSITYSYAGFENAFNVLAEVKDPIKSVKKAGTLALSVISVLYVLVNVAYFAASEWAENVYQ
jgi:amino acid transporter